MITRRALHADGARLLSAAATPRAARVGGDAYTPSPAIFALAQEHREAIMKETTSGQPEFTPRSPQSTQSVPSVHPVYSAPGPPSSQYPSLAQLGLPSHLPRTWNERVSQLIIC